eukprot:2405724-Amphidinium_carterae.1
MASHLAVLNFSNTTPFSSAPLYSERMLENGKTEQQLCETREDRRVHFPGSCYYLFILVLIMNQKHVVKLSSSKCSFAAQPPGFALCGSIPR